MSTVKSDNSDLTINAAGSTSDIKFQANGVEKASISSAGAFTSTTIDATKLTGTLPAIDGGSLTNLPAGGVAGISTSSTSGTQQTIDNNGICVGGLATTGHAGRFVIRGDTASNGPTASSDPDQECAVVFKDTRSPGSQWSAGVDSGSFMISDHGVGKNRITISANGQFRVSSSGGNPSANTGTGQASGNGGWMLNSSGGITMAIQDANSYFNYTGTGGDCNWKFRWGGSDKGSIVWNSSATSYNTSSDYRLKENVVPMTGSIDRLKALKPSRFNFIADANTTVDGFLAHEAQEVVPEAITGTKDAIDDEGNPDMQGIDQSKLVPLLVASLQEAIARIEVLEAQLKA
jgi:hypothetical protein